jgi:quinohemoprotein ethanol dehydrogenase
MRTTRAIYACAAVLAGVFQVAYATGYGGKEIANEQDGQNWLAYGRTYSEQHASPLAQITSDNVSRLGLVWSLDLPGVHNGLTVPLEVDGVVYFTVDQSLVHAVDVRTGKLLWRFDPEVYKVAGKKFRLSWGPRGIAYWRGKIYVATLDGRLIALDARTGKKVWSQQTVPTDDTANITGAPRVFNGKVIIGHGGADFGPIRGYVTAYDAQTGKQLWRFYAVPGDPAKGFEDKAQEMAARTWTGQWWQGNIGGGGTIWDAITYDPQLNRVYVGTGNGHPHDWKERSPGGGDNLFLSSIVALDADTGAYVWHYQIDPGNSWDYNSDMDITTATLTIGGRPRKVLMNAPKNGFLYVIDRETGKLLSAEKIEYVNWAERIDLKTGRPVENPEVRAGKIELWPSATGAHSIMTQAFNPQTKLLYIPTIRSGNGAFGGAKLVDIPDRDTTNLRAWDPVSQKEVWSVKTPGFWNGGVMTTAGNLVFEGMGDGKLNAYDARNGRQLWSFDAHFGITGSPITYEVDGKQYVSVVAGWGGTGAAFSGHLTTGYGWQTRIHKHRLLTFVLDGKTPLPPQAPPAVAVPIDDPSFVVDPQRAKAGAGVYFGSMCLGCHGFYMIGGGYAPDLRASRVPLSADAFREVVKKGSLLSRGMPQFDELSDDDLESLRHFIRQRARETMVGGVKH